MERVTNEQAENDIAKYRYYSEANKTILPLIKKHYDYASDLLNARAERDKAIAMVREMQGIIEQQLVTRYDRKIRKLFMVWLEKSKDYAE